MSQSYNNIDGLLLLDKPFGITSFEAVHKIKKVLNVEKTGHCGTLDPAATGLLLVLVGKATKL
jgi:tRNA pseudouridine55 synthase